MNSPAPSGSCSPRSYPLIRARAAGGPTHRRVLNAILFRTRTGLPWRDLPERFGPWETAAGRHRRWCLDDTWQRIADRLRIDAATGEELIAGVDSTSVRAHHHTAGAA